MTDVSWNLVDSTKFFQEIITDESGQNIVGFFNNQIYRSSDYGDNWSTGVSINGTNYVNNITGDINLQYIVVAGCLNGGLADHLYRSTDSGASFSPLTNSPSAIWNVITSSSNGQYLVAGQADNAFKDVYYSTDYGSSWTISDCSNLFWYNLLSSSNGQHVIISGNDNTNTTIYISSNYGANFTYIGPIINTIYAYVSNLTCDATGQYVYASMGSRGIYKSGDYGATWTSTNADITNGQNYGSISSDATGQHILVYENAGYDTYLSSDFGSNWILQYIPGTHGMGDGYGHVKISSNDYSRYSNTDNGVGLFRNLNENLPPDPPNPPNLACFYENTKICSDNGYIPIKNLRKGDLVKTLKHGYVAIDMIGYREMQNVISAERIKDKLYVCTNNEYPELLEDLIMTGCHAILVDEFKEDEKEKTSDLLGQICVTDHKYRLPVCLDKRANPYEENGPFTIYHIALVNDDYYMNYGIYANGLLVETCSKRYLKELSEMILIE